MKRQSKKSNRPKPYDYHKDIVALIGEKYLEFLQGNKSERLTKEMAFLVLIALKHKEPDKSIPPGVTIH